MYVIDLKSLSRKNINLAGGKGSGLGELLKNNFLVPEGFVISTIAYEKYLVSNGIYITEDEEDDYLKICECIKNGKFPEDMLKEIKEAYYNLGKDIKVAVRSSPTAEDLSDSSFAGQQENYLNVQGFENVLIRIKDCFASCFTYKSVKYRKNNGYGFSEIKTAVIVQEMVEAEVSGVLFTENILEGNKREMLIEASYGLGKSIVSDTINKNKYILNEIGKVDRKYIGKNNQFVLNNEQLKRLYKIGKTIKRIWINNVDIEWALKDNKFYILHSRTIESFESNFFEKLSLPKNEDTLSKRQKKRLSFILGHTPYVFYPLDFQLTQTVEKTRRDILYDIGIELGESLIIDNRGIVSLTTPRRKVNKNIFNTMKRLKDFFDIKNNRIYGKKAFEECKREFYEIESKNTENMTLRECSNLFVSLANLLEKIGMVRFKYFIVPMIISKKFNFIFKRKEKNEIFDDREYPCCTSRINDEIQKLISHIPKNNDKEELNEFLEKYGCESEYTYYPFSSSCWMEGKEEFYSILDLFSKNKEWIHNKRYDTFIKDSPYFNECNMYQEELKYLWEKCTFLLRSKLKYVAKVLNRNVKDLWFLFFNELLEVCNREALSEEDNKNIRLRMLYREEAEVRWNNLYNLASDESNDRNIVTGINANSGTKVGRACLVLEKGDFSKIKSGDIIICRHIPPEWIPLFSIASAVVSDTGGLVSHSVSIARKYNIPLVLATGNATSRIHDGDKIIVNGSKGIVSFCY